MNRETFHADDSESWSCADEKNSPCGGASEATWTFDGFVGLCEKHWSDRSGFDA